MPDKNLSDNMVKLVSYAIASIQRNQERIIYCGTRVVTDNMSGEGFAAWVIAEYLQKPGHKEISNSAKKYLRVYYKVLDRWPRESLHFEEKQLATLRQIRDAIPVKGVEPPTSGEGEKVKPEREKRTAEELPELEDTAEKPESEAGGLSALVKKIMEVLKAAKGALWASQVAEDIGESKDNVLNALRDLEASGHVERRGSRYGRLES